MNPQHVHSLTDKMSPSEATSYAGSAATIGASLTLTEIGVVVGIITALLTFAMNLYFTKRKEKRELRESDLRAQKEQLEIELLRQQLKEKQHAEQEHPGVPGHNRGK
jgi:H+/gluconate symporter-like permease